MAFSASDLRKELRAKTNNFTAADLRRNLQQGIIAPTTTQKEPEPVLSKPVAWTSRSYDYNQAVNQYNDAIMTEAMKQTAKGNMNAAESAIIGADPTKRFVAAPNQLAPIDTQSSYAYQVKASDKYKGMTYDELKKANSELYANRPLTPNQQGLPSEYDPRYASVYNEYQRAQAQYEGETKAVQKAIGDYFAKPIQSEAYEKTANKGAQNTSNLFRQPEGGFFRGVGMALRGNPLDYATEEEKRLGDYWYGVSKDEGDKYYKWLLNILTARSAGDIATNADTFGESIGLAAIGGLDQFFSGVINTVKMATGSDNVYQGVLSQANQQNIAQVAEDSWLGKIGLQLITTTANMAPSILIGSANPLIGSVSMGVSASGNAYSQAIISGADPLEAAVYGLLIGASETTLQYFMSKVPGLSKSGAVIANKIDDAIKTVAKSQRVINLLEGVAKFGTAATAEGFEEFLQEIIDPILQNAILNQDADIDLAEALEAGLIGALSGGAFSIPGSISNAKVNNKKAQQAQQPQTAEPAAPVAPTQPEAPAVTVQPTVTRPTLNNDGTPKVFYHGTSANYDTFDVSKTGGLLSFTENRAIAEQYAKGGGGRRDPGGYNNIYIVSYDGNVYEKSGTAGWVAVGLSLGTDENGPIVDRTKTTGEVKIGDFLETSNMAEIMEGVNEDYYATPKQHYMKSQYLSIHNPINIRDLATKYRVASKLEDMLDFDTNKALDSKLVKDIKWVIWGLQNSFWDVTKSHTESVANVIPILQEWGYDGFIYPDDGGDTTWVPFNVDQVIPVQPVQEITQTLKSTGEISAAQIDTIVKSPENRAVFAQETGVELPAAVGDARRAIRAYQADINSTQANTAAQPATIDADATSPQTGVDAPPAQTAVVEPVNAQASAVTPQNARMTPEENQANNDAITVRAVSKDLKQFGEMYDFHFDTILKTNATRKIFEDITGVKLPLDRELAIKAIRKYINKVKKTIEAEYGSTIGLSMEERMAKTYGKYGPYNPFDLGSKIAKINALLYSYGIDPMKNKVVLDMVFEADDLIRSGDNISIEAVAQAIYETYEKYKDQAIYHMTEVFDRGFELDGSIQPDWYKEQYHPTPEQVKKQQEADKRYRKEMDAYKKLNDRINGKRAQESATPKTAPQTATVAKASPKQKQTISGYHTPVKAGLEKIANAQSAGLPSGYFIALDKPFESSAHNADKAYSVDANVNNVYDPNGLFGKATPDYTSEMVDYVSQNATASGLEIISQTRDLMRDFLLSKGYDAYVRAIDGQRNNRELIIFDKNNVKENKSTTKKTQTATAVMERPTQADTDTDAEIAENKVGEGDVWQTTRIGTDEDVKSLTQIVKQAYTDLDIPIIRGGIKGRRSVQGQYRTGAQTIHIRTNNDILTIAHEVGHHLDTQHRLVSTASPEARQELLNNLSPGMAAAYKANQLPAEGVAEFFRYYFTNADEARAAYPEFSAHVDNKLPQKTLDVINRLAQSMNTYLSAPVYEQYLSAVSMSTDNAPTLAEKWQGVKDKFTEYFIDDLAGLKRFGDAVENTRSYILAQNSRYASGTVDALLKTELRDMNGKYVGESLLKAVEDINVKDAAELRAFNLYLILKHAPERIGDMKKVFANPELESQANIDASVAKLEAQYPSFASAADRVYQFQKNLLKAYGVDSGLISQKVADEWDKKYPHYIPLQRDLSNTKKKSAKNATSKVNQSLSPFKAAKGSGLDILAPLEGIVWNTNRMVLAAKSNAVRIATTEAAATTVGAGKFLEREKIPTELKKFNAIELKKNTIEALKNSTSVDENVLKNVIDSVIEDTLEQYTRSSKIQDNIMLVMKNGEPQYWRVNDTMLLHSLENVGTQTVKGFWDAYGKVTRVITQAATGGNVVWSIFSNALRDIQTGAIYDRSGNTGKWLLNIGKAYYQQVTDKAAREKGLTPSRMSEYYREYLSLGGANNISRISADRADTAKSFSGLLSKKQYLNPLDAIASVSDVIEQAPRFAEYASLREKGVQAGNAFYQAMDVTVNFRRGGTWSRQINKAIPFYNASIQGLDKMFRNFTAADVPVSSRKKIMTRRFAKHAALSAIVAFAQIVPKLFDEDEKKDYEQLSAYQKNGAYNIYLGDGKFFSIKKPRELGILTSFFERTMEYALLTNKDAYYEFASYASEQLLPPLLDVLPLVASGDMDAVGGSLASTFGAAGSLFALTLNVDYRGNPIVSEALGRLQPKFQYDESTSFLAKTLGGVLNLSPKKIDYVLNTWLGMYQTVNKSLFPVGGAERDWTLGVANTYVKDNQYSQDIVNKFYTSKTTTDKNSASYPDKSAYKIQSKDYGSMAQFYSNTVKIAQNTDMTTPLNRAARQTVLEMLEQFSTEIDSGNASPTKQSMDKLATETGDTSFYPQTMGVVFTYTPNKGNRVEIALTYTQYLQYQTAYNAYYYNEVGKALNKSYKNADDKMSAVQKAKREAKEKIDKEMFSLLTGRK